MLSLANVPTFDDQHTYYCDFMFKNLTNLASTMRNMTQIGSQMKLLNAKLDASRVVGNASSMGLAVNVEMNGLGSVRSIRISEDLMAIEHKVLLEQLTKDSMNQAIKSSKELHISAFKELTGGVELFPGLNEMLENMVK